MLPRISLLVALAILGGARTCPGIDCNANAVDDALDISAGTSRDCDSNGVPDECDVLAPSLRLGAPLAFPLGEFADTAVLADLNGDGLSDVAACGSRLWILLGRGRGEFQPTVAYDEGGGSVAAGEIDGDGDIDLLTIHAYEGYALTNDGNGSFEAGPDFPAKGDSTVLDDLDNDGDLDAVVAANFFQVLLNEGGVFTPGAVRDVFGGPVSVAAGDMDGDGDADLTAHTTYHLWLFRNDGTGTFPDPEYDPMPGGFRWIALEDTRGDGDLDIVFHDGEALCFLENDGGGGFPSKTSLAIPLLVEHAIVEDLDLDGLPEIAVAVRGEAGRDGVLILRDPGDGAFVSAYTPVGLTPRWIAAGDLDGDGQADLAVVQQGSENLLVLPVSPGSLEMKPAPRIEVGLLAGRAASLDVEGDGDRDLVVLGEDRAITITNEGNRSFTRGAALEVGLWPADIVAEDLNADERPDLAVVNRGSNNVSVLLASPGGGFLERVNYGFGFAPVALEAADLDADGDMDLAYTNFESSDVGFLRNEGDGSFGPATLRPVGRSAEAIAAADLNRDGLVDLAVAWHQSVNILENSGGASFVESGSHTVGLGIYSLAIGDWDLDGRLDIAASVWSRSSIDLLRGSGGGEFGVPLRIDTISAPLEVVSVDFEADGLLDLAVAGGTAWSLSAHRGLGHGLFGEPVHFLAGGLVAHLHAADLDGDGKTDVVTSDGRTGTLSFLWNGTEPPAGADCDQNGIPDACEISSGGALDCDGNSVPDPCDPDCDGDGVPDACEVEDCNANGLPDACEVAPGLSFGGARSLPLGGEGVASVASDLDLDGDQDLVVAAGRSVLVYLQIEASDLFGPERYETVLPCTQPREPCCACVQPSALHAKPVSLAVADLDGYGYPDIAVLPEGSSSVLVLRDRLNGEFEAPVEIAAGVPLASLAAADMNGDEAADLLLLVAESSTLLVLASDGDGGFLEPVTVELAGLGRSVIPGDFDGDSDLDLALLGAAGSASILVHEGGLHFLEGSLVRSGISAMTAGDIDGDSDTDLALLEEAAGSIRFLRNDGGGLVTEVPSGATVAGATAILACDLDDDGRDDLAAAVPSRGEVAALRSLGDGSYARPIRIDAGRDPRHLGCAQVEGSAGKDLVVVDRAGARLFLIPNVSERPSSRDDDRNGVPDDCERTEFHRGDVNSDSNLDISDPVKVLEYLFLEGSDPSCLETADANGDAAIDISDPIFLLSHLFLGGEAPSDPGPPSSPCGPDPDLPGSPGDLGCGEYTGCREEAP